MCAETDAVSYPVASDRFPARSISYAWRQSVEAPLAAQILELMRAVSASAPIIGFGTDISEAEALAYIAELRENLAAGKCRLLVIRADGQQLIGLCTLRRNLNPNNRHIGDLAKGMIAEEYRGGAVLAAAFREIALQCERDGIEVVTLDVRAGTAASAAWQRYGFETYGMLDDYARARGQVFAGQFMKQRVVDLKGRAAAALAAKSTAPPTHPKGVDDAHHL